MFKIDIETVKIDKIILNDKNPRSMTKKGLSKMQKSIEDFPEMLLIREIVVDENYKLLGGEKRLLAKQKIGDKEVTVKKVSGLSEGEKNEFMLKDNTHFGAWDYDMLYNTFDDQLLIDAGLELQDHDGTLLQYLRDTKDNEDTQINELVNNNIDNNFIPVYLSDEYKTKIDKIKQIKKFSDYSETVVWLLNEI